MINYGWITWLVAFCLVTKANLRRSQECPGNNHWGDVVSSSLYSCKLLSVLVILPSPTESCQKPLGIENGLISDEQLSAFSSFNNDSSTYGVHRARLKISSWPPGYRALKRDHYITLPWIRIDLEKEMVVTGIATQGYGDSSVAEWVTSFKLMYADQLNFDFFLESNGIPQVSKSLRNSR